MTAYLDVVQLKVKSFVSLNIFQIPRDQNTPANIGLAMRKSGFKSIPIVHMSSPAIDKPTEVSDFNEITTTLISLANADHPIP